MANALKANVWVVDTSGAFPMPNNYRICGVKLMGGSDAATLTLKKTNSSGTVIHEMEAATTVNVYEEVEIRGNTGLYATITGTDAKAYIYLE